MRGLAAGRRLGRVRVCASVRGLVAVLLLGLFATEILPCTFVMSGPLVPGGSAGVACVLEPLQVCDHGDPLLGGLSDVPVLPPAAPERQPGPTGRLLFAEVAAVAPDGFRTAIDHPPRLAA